MFNEKTKILVVDDMSTMRKIVTNVLRMSGFNKDLIQEAEDGEKAWSILESQPIDLIVSDWNMPNMTGIELLRKVRTNGLYKDLPFILLTAENEAGQIKEAISLKVDGYVMKPFKPNDLKAQLVQAYKKFQKRSEL